MKYRQIVQLPQQPRLIRFIEPNSSVVALENNTILLTDMSSEYTVESTLYKGHDCIIRDIQVVHENFFGSLDVKGSIKIWSLKGTEIQRRRRSQGVEGGTIQIGARQKFPSTSICANKTNSGQLAQTIDRKFRCFLVHHRHDSGGTHMFAATETGRVLLYQWNDVKSLFELRQSLSFHTHVGFIEKLVLIPDLTIMMTINCYGASEFFNLKDHSKTFRTSRISFPMDAPINVHPLSSDIIQNPAALNNQQTIAIVYFDCVYQVTISHVGQVLLTDVVEAYRTTNEQNFITCSTITDDRKYLILGTKKGIIVFDPLLKREVLRNGISDNILCIDVCSLDDEIYRYILISTTKRGGAVMNVHGIQAENDTVEWATNRNGSPLNGMNMVAQGTSNTWPISSSKVFDVIPENEDSYKLVVAKARSLVQYHNDSASLNESIVLCNAEDTITSISIASRRIYYGCENGRIYELNVERPVTQLKGSVEYLKYYELFDVLIASTRTNGIILPSKDDLSFEGKLVLTTFLFQSRFIILVHEDCSFHVSFILSQILYSFVAVKTQYC